MKPEEIKNNDKLVKKTIDRMLKDYKDNPQREDLYKSIKLDRIEFLLNTYESKGYDLTKQRIEYQKYHGDLK